MEGKEEVLAHPPAHSKTVQFKYCHVRCQPITAVLKFFLGHGHGRGPKPDLAIFHGHGHVRGLMTSKPRAACMGGPGNQTTASTLAWQQHGSSMTVACM